VLAFLEHPAWVIDGNYSGLAFERRMAEADEILFLDFSALRCLWRAAKRYLTHRGKTRSSMTENCPEKFDWTFFLWLIRDGRTSVRRTRFDEIAQRHPQKLRRLRCPKDVAGYLAELNL
jgi:Adenylate kinase and related kinases